MKTRPQNLLILLSDEHNPHALGCAGHPLVQTPHLDRLSEQGTRFASAYSNSPICVPARAALATGRYIHQTRYWDNALAYEGTWLGWGHVLQKNGHRVESIGKLHYRQETDPTGFDRQTDPMHIVGGYGMVWGAVRDPLPVFRQRASQMLQPIGAGLSSYNAYDLRITEQTCRWLQSAAQAGSEKP